MSKRARLANGEILQFPDDTPDDVMDRAVQGRIAELMTPSKGTVTPQQAQQSFASNPNRFGVSDNRSATGVLGDSIMNNLEGVGQFAAGLPGMIKDTAGAAMDLIRPGGMQRNVNRGMENLQSMGNAVLPMVDNAANLGMNLSGARSVVPQVSEEQNRTAGNFSGQFMAPMIMGEGAANLRTPRGYLEGFTTPEARLAAADAARAKISPLSDALSGRMNQSGLIQSGLKAASNLANRASIPINEALAKYLANGKPYGINRPPTFTEPDTTPATPNTSGPSADLTALKDALERERLRNVAEAEAKGRMDPRQMNNPPQFTEPSVGESYAGSSSRGKINPVRPDYSNALARAIEEYQAKPPQVLDGPSVNKWMGTRPADLMRGADPGKFLVDEGLIGVDKAATLQKVIPALDSTEGKLGSLLKAADEKGVTVNAKSVFDEAIADATKPFGEGTDETFQKKLDQITTDANAQVGDLSEIKPTENHQLKKMIGDQIDWNAKETTPYQKVLKQIYRGLNNQLGDVNPDIRSTQLRWQNLEMARRNLDLSMRTNLVGKGTNPNPLAEALKKRNP